MAQALEMGGHRKGLAQTSRTDVWWLEPLATGAGFLAFVLYSTWAAFQASHYFFDPYLSPFYSPLLFVNPDVAGGAPVEHAWFGAWPAWWPAWLPASPAFFILAFPLSFRLTCYYYRKFYYRSYFLSPPACAVGAFPQSKYKGETVLFLFQNLHRFTLYFAIAFIALLYYDGFMAFFKDGKFGVGVGTIVLLINPTLLALYTFGCHSFRHLTGGRLDCFSCDAASSARHKVFEKVSWLNARHMRFAWFSLFWVGFSDVYVRLVSMGVIHDFSTWGN
jgi:hypothetical protein